VVSHGQSTLVAALIADIARIGPAMVSEIIIVHNMSDDRHVFPESASHIPIIHIVNKHKCGFGENHNSAFKIATQPFFAVLNPDLRIDTDPFSALLLLFETKNIGLVAPKILNPDGTTACSARRLYSPYEIILGPLNHDKNVVPPHWLAGMFLLFRRSSFEGVQGFDKRYFMYVEDVDISARITLAGWKILFEPSVSVIHDARRASRRSPQHTLWHFRSALRWWFGPVFWKYRAFLASKTQRTQ
jgi:N-acetylglucosaminyl-diphospho-decaprenol L-rhamnosyltransferase